VVRWQGRGLLYWGLKTNLPHVWKDLLVRGVELGPTLYYRRPSTSCLPDSAGSLGYIPTIGGLEYFSQQKSAKIPDVDLVRNLYLARSSGQRHLGSPWPKSSFGCLKPDPICFPRAPSWGVEKARMMRIKMCTRPSSVLVAALTPLLAEVQQERGGVTGLLTRAIISGQPGAVWMLLRAGVDIKREPEIGGWSPLTYAAVNIDCRVLGVLLSHEGTRSVLDHRDENGCTFGGRTVWVAGKRLRCCSRQEPIRIFEAPTTRAYGRLRTKEDEKSIIT
jgi:hypothetical protein